MYRCCHRRYLGWFGIVVILLSTPLSQAFASKNTDDAPPYSDCEIDDYYQSFWKAGITSKEELGQLLKSTHRHSLPYTSSSQEDTWDALRDLDRGSTPNTVHLIYKDVDVDAALQGEWNREHLWPRSLGVGSSGYDTTDVHALRPSDANVNSSRGNKYYGDCGLVRPFDECTIPAHVEAAESTAADPEVWLPPTDVRGDIARAIFYMEVRYNGDGSDPDLLLSDCPSSSSSSGTTMGYLSQLLEWHNDDPVDDDERKRNHLVCTRWQGNRNPFVDYPWLVYQFYGTPQNEPQEDGAGYNQCEPYPSDFMPSPPIDGSSPSSPCAQVAPGDLAVVSFLTDNPDVVALVALTTLPEGLELYLTDQAWMGSDFRDSSEGLLMMTVPFGGIAAGTVFGFGDSSLEGEANWSPISGTLALSTGGDSVLVYCVNDDNDNEIQFLTGLTNDNGSWMEADLPSSSYGSHGSALPTALEGQFHANLAMPHYDNYVYVGPTAGSLEELKTALSSLSLWWASNSRSTTPSIPTQFIIYPTNNYNPGRHRHRRNSSSVLNSDVNNNDTDFFQSHRYNGRGEK